MLFKAQGDSNCAFNDCFSDFPPLPLLLLLNAPLPNSSLPHHHPPPVSSAPTLLSSHFCRKRRKKKLQTGTVRPLHTFWRLGQLCITLRFCLADPQGVVPPFLLYFPLPPDPTQLPPAISRRKKRSKEILTCTQRKNKQQTWSMIWHFLASL